MNTLTLFTIGTLTTALLGSGSLLAREMQSTPGQNRYQFQQLAQADSDRNQQVLRERAQTRTMSQEERRLMQDTGFNGQARMSEESSRGNSSSYGRGFESRQMQQNAPGSGPSNFGSTGGNAGMGAQGGGHSRGR